MNWLSTIYDNISHDNCRLKILQMAVAPDQKLIVIYSCILVVFFMGLDPCQHSTLLDFVELFVCFELTLRGKGVHAVFTIAKIDLVLDI